MLGDVLIDFPPYVFNSFFFEPSAHKLARLADQQALGTQQSLPTPRAKITQTESPILFCECWDVNSDPAW